LVVFVPQLSWLWQALKMGCKELNVVLMLMSGNKDVPSRKILFKFLDGTQYHDELMNYV